MSAEAIYVTREFLESTQVDVRELKTKGRKEIAQKIADARAHGDLSENADYDAAKHEQELLEIRISRMEGMLSRAQVIEAGDFPDDKIYILSRVRLVNKKINREIEYLLVSPEEADVEQNKLSVTCPLGKALLGKAVGDIVETRAPVGIIQYEVLGISK